jgi:hypothetical protein
LKYDLHHPDNFFSADAVRRNTRPFLFRQLGLLSIRRHWHNPDNNNRPAVAGQDLVNINKKHEHEKNIEIIARIIGGWLRLRRDAGAD